MPSLRIAVIAVAAGLVAGTVGCTTTRPPVSKPTAVQDVRHDYLAYWSELIHASADSNPHDPGLAEHAASTMLATLQQNLTVSRDHSFFARGSVGHHITDVTIANGIATVTDCVNLDPWLLYNSRTGKLVSSQYKDRPHQLAVYTLAQHDGVWVVTQDQVVGQCLSSPSEAFSVPEAASRMTRQASRHAGSREPCPIRRGPDAAG